MFGKHLCAEEPSENLLKMIKVKCVWIITFSFKDNKKFSINKNMCLNTLKVAEIDEHQLNSFTSMMRILIPLSASVFKGNKFDCLLCWFVPTHNKVHSVRFSKKMNYYIITALNLYQSVQMTAMYK